MALTETAPPRQASPRGEPARASFLESWWALGAAVAALLLIFGWTYVAHPGIIGPTRDPFWYTWRAELLGHVKPGSIVPDWGPFGMFSGGYRVTTPIVGALLTQLGGADRFTFSILDMVGIPILASLALGAFAYRHRRDPLLFFLTIFASAALFLSTVYVGYMDNLMCLYLLALVLPFLQPARTSWGARSAIFLFIFLATLTHPTTTAVFDVVLIAGAGLHLLTSRFSILKTLRSDGAMLVSAGLGSVFGLAMWKAGAWGVKAQFAEAAKPPPYPASSFKETLRDWVTSLDPWITGPLVAIAIVAIVAVAFRRRGEPTDEYSRMSLLWLLPLLGVFGWALGKSYPYYRFMNTTLALMLLVGMGAWVAVIYFVRRSRAAGAVALAVILAALGYVMSSGWTTWSDPGNRFLLPQDRAAMQAVQAYAAAGDPDRPIVFVNDYPVADKTWGWSKTYANAARAGLTGDQALRSGVFFGDFRDFAAGRPSAPSDLKLKDCDPIPDLPARSYECVSLGFFEETQHRLAPYSKSPQVFLLRIFNPHTDNLSVIDSSEKLAPGVAVATGPGLAPISSPALRAARAAYRVSAAEVADPPGRFSDPLGLLRVLAVLAFVLLVPGLIAMRWFELEDGPSRLALVPGTSLGLFLFSAFAVIAVHRAPFGVADQIAAALVAVGIALVLAYMARRREAGRAVVMPFVHRSMSLFANTSFGMLMGAVFLAVLGDGIVQGSLAKTIAFGGKAGFSIDQGGTPRHILALVLLLYLPYTFISPFLGVLIDRFDRRKLLTFANAGRAVVIFLLGVGLLFGHLPDIVLIVGLLLTLASTRLVLAIKSAGIPGVLQGRDLIQGNSISQAGQAVSQLIGAGIALVGTKIVSSGVVIASGAIVYAIGAGFAIRVTGLAEKQQTMRFAEGARRIVRNIAEGLREVRSRAAAKLALFSFLALRTLFAFVLLVFALEARTLLGGKSDKLALLIPALAGALGAGLGFVAAQSLKDRVQPPKLLAGSMVMMGGGVMVFGGIVSVLGLSAIAFVAALAYFVGKISADTLTQRALPDDFRGRAFSLFDVAYNLAWIIPALVLFALWSGGRVRVLLIGSGLLFLACAAVVVVWGRKIEDDLDPGNREQAPATL